MASLSRSARLFAGALCLTVVAAPMPAAWAHEDHQPAARSAEASTLAAPVAGAACKKAGTKSGTFTCKKVKGKLVWVGTTVTPVVDALCSAL